MSYVAFTKQGLRYYKWNGETKEYEVKERKTYIPSLREECQIEQGVTLGDIFDAVEADPPLKAFIAMYSWCNAIDEFHKQAKRTPPAEDSSEHLHFLQIYWNAELWHYHKKKLTNSMDISYGFHARGDYQDYEGKPACKSDPDYTWYSVSCTPMYHIAHLPVYLNHEIEVEEIHCGTNHERKVVFKGERVFSLLEVLDAIYDDISFYGSPSESAAFLEDMQETVERIKSGEEKTFSMEDIFGALEDDDDEDETEKV